MLISGGNMNIINKRIRSLIIEIIFLSVLVIVSGMYWSKLEINQSLSTKYLNERNFEPLSMDITNNIDMLYPTNDYTNSYIDIKLENKTDIDKEYVIYLIIDDTYINTNYLKIKINNNNDYLNNLENVSIKGKTYYVISENVSKNNTIENIKCYLWLTDETPNTEQNKNINFTFKIDEI